MNDYPIVTDENGVPRAPVPPSLVTVTRVVYALHALSILIGVFTGASIATAFENQLDALYAAESMDLSADLTVLQNMLKGQGL